MFKDRQGAIELNQILEEISKLIDKGRNLVHGDNFSAQDRWLYSYNMGGLVLGVEMLDIFEEIYYEHPDLVPPDAQPWPTSPPKRKQIDSELSELEKTARTHYEILQVDPRAEIGLIQQAHKYLAAKYLSKNEITGNKEMLGKVDAAWRVVGDKKRRAEYDESLREIET